VSRISSKFNYSLVLIRHHAQQQHTCRIPGEGCWPYSLLRVGDERSHDAILCDGGGIPAWKCYGTLKSALSSVWCATRSAANGACNRNGCTRNCTFWAEMHSRTPKACTPLFYPVENLRPEMSWVGRELVADSYDLVENLIEKPDFRTEIIVACGLMSVTHAPETGTENLYQKTGTIFPTLVFRTIWNSGSKISGLIFL